MTPDAISNLKLRDQLGTTQSVEIENGRLGPEDLQDHNNKGMEYLTVSQGGGAGANRKGSNQNNNNNYNSQKIYNIDAQGQLQPNRSRMNKFPEQSDSQVKVVLVTNSSIGQGQTPKAVQSMKAGGRLSKSPHNKYN